MQKWVCVYMEKNTKSHLSRQCYLDKPLILQHSMALPQSIQGLLTFFPSFNVLPFHMLKNTCLHVKHATM